MRRPGPSAGPQGAALAAALLGALCPAGGIMEPSGEEKRLAWKYPGCDHLVDQGHRRVDWPSVRLRLVETPYPSSIKVVYEVLESMSGLSAEYDEEARLCMMGIPAIFYILTRYSLDSAFSEEDQQWDPEGLRRAILQYSVLENYISCLDPGLINRANWSFTNEEVMTLRRRILRAYRQLETSGPSPAEYAAPQRLRVYVYDEDEVPELTPLVQSQIYCGRGQWGTDVQVHDFFLTSPSYTDDPAQADFFFRSRVCDLHAGEQHPHLG